MCTQEQQCYVLVKDHSNLDQINVDGTDRYLYIKVGNVFLVKIAKTLQDLLNTAANL